MRYSLIQVKIMNEATKMKLAPYVTAGFQGKTLYLGFGSIRQAIDAPEFQEAILTAAATWKNFMTSTSIKAVLEKNASEAVRLNVEKAIQYLLSGKYLIAENSYEKTNRYSRHALYYNMSGAVPAQAQNNLSNKHVVILGCGGIGNIIATSLATSGIGKISLVDGDVIEKSNLTRQLMFTERDDNHKKVDILGEAILQRNSEIKVKLFDLTIKSKRLSKKLTY